MSNETLFYICGIALAVSAVLVSFVGLKVKDFPGRALPLVILWFAILVGGATTFAVLHAKDEEEAEGGRAREGRRGDRKGRGQRTPRRAEPKAKQEDEGGEGPEGSRRPEAPKGAGRRPCSSPPTRPRWPSTRPN